MVVGDVVKVECFAGVEVDIRGRFEGGFGLDATRTGGVDVAVDDDGRSGEPGQVRADGDEVEGAVEPPGGEGVDL